jgi:hypothetical protein
MPTLDGEAKALYVAAYGEDVYNKFTDDDNDQRFHGGLNTGEAQGGFLHLPRHDVESVFWTLLSSILHAYPSAGDPETTTDKRFDAALKALESHIIDKSQIDYRDNLLGFRAYKFQEALHSDLATLAPMLESMCHQIRPEYSFLSPAPQKEHLHEAMRRILLRQIVSMGRDAIPLDPKKVRVPTANGKPLENYRGSRGTKRFLTTPDLPVVVGSEFDARKSKRSRSKGAYHSHAFSLLSLMYHLCPS